jgi:hypothetical protein
MTALAPQSPAPQAAAASAHRKPACSGGRVRNRRERLRAARCVAGPDPARAARTARWRRPESGPPSASAHAAPFTAARSGHGMAESP